LSEKIFRLVVCKIKNDACRNRSKNHDGIKTMLKNIILLYNKHDVFNILLKLQFFVTGSDFVNIYNNVIVINTYGYFRKCQ